MMPRSRFSARQIAHGSTSVMFQHRAQNVTVSRIWAIASLRLRDASGGIRSK
jgi:hypothetical protein